MKDERIKAVIDNLSSLIADHDAVQRNKTPAPEHVCGLSGYNRMIDPPCPGCEVRRPTSEP